MTDPREAYIARTGPMVVLCLAVLMLVGAMESGWLNPVLEALGMSHKGARLASARITVVLVFFGAGFLSIGLAWLARVARYRAAWTELAGVLAPLAERMRVPVRAIDGVGLSLTGDVGGIRAEVLVETARRGSLWVRARCVAAVPASIWPRGIGPDAPLPGWTCAVEGSNWEIWHPVGQQGVSATRDLEHVLAPLFREGSAISIHHDLKGIEVRLQNEPLDQMVSRIQLGIDGIAAVARANR